MKNMFKKKRKLLTIQAKLNVMFASFVIQLVVDLFSFIENNENIKI